MSSSGASGCHHGYQNIQSILAHIHSYKLILQITSTNGHTRQTCQPRFNLFYTRTICERTGIWPYLGHKTITPVSIPFSLISVLWSIFAFLYVIPSSHPWLTWCWSGLRRGMLGEVICDLRLDGSEHLYDHELCQVKKQSFLENKVSE